MPQPITVGILDGMRQNLADLAGRKARTLPGLRHCDLRVQVKEEKGAMAENGHEKASAEDATTDFGVRVISGAGAAGYYGGILGVSDLENIESVIWQGIRQAHQRARASARLKKSAKARFDILGQSLSSTELAPVPIAQATAPATYTQDPRLVPLSERPSRWRWTAVRRSKAKAATSSMPPLPPALSCFVNCT